MQASVVAYGSSHVGNVRSDNQDAIRACQPEGESLDTHGLLYGVADGMGGYEHGGIASSLALETFFSAVYAGSPTKPAQNMRQGMQEANLAVFQAGQRLGARMGTTLSAVNVVGQQLHLAHIGDSRVYLVRGRSAICLTNDHTAVGELVRMRLLSPDKVRTHERRSILDKSLGMALFVQPDISTHLLDEDDYLILCTDGVWAYVEDDEFARIVQEAEEPQPISQTLIDLAMQRSSDDNVSALVLHVERLGVPALAAARSGRGFTQLFWGRLTGKA